jgi:hypothetical protein
VKIKTLYTYCEQVGRRGKDYETTIKAKTVPITGLNRPMSFQEVEAPRFLDNRHMKVVKLSALRTGHLYSLRNIPGTYFSRG